jgi:hypothetical protein
MTPSLSVTLVTEGTYGYIAVEEKRTIVGSP